VDGVRPGPQGPPDQGTAADPRPLRRLVTANAFSSVGDGVRFAALPLLAASVSGGDPLDVSVVAAAGRVAWLLAPVVGALVDRSDRRSAMVGADLARGVGLAALGLTVLAGRVPVAALALLAFVAGVAEVFFDTAAQAVVPALAEPARLERVNARLVAAQTVGTGFVGPPAGAALWALWHPLPFLLDATTFLVSAWVLRGLAGWLPRRQGAGADDGRPTARRVLRDMRAGLRVLVETPVLRRLVAAVVVLGVAQQAVYAVLVVYVTRTLGLPSSAYGWLLAVAAVGSLAGARAAAGTAARMGVRGSLVASVALSAGTYLTVAAVPHWPVVAVMLACNSAGVVLWNVVTVSLRQRLIPLDLLGRVTSGYRLAAWGVMPVGSVLGGALADRVGLAAPWLVSGALLLAALPLVAGIRAEPDPGSG
jgi:MFS family permease